MFLVAFAYCSYRLPPGASRLLAGVSVIIFRVLRLGFAAAVALTTYAVALSAFTRACPHDQMAAPVVYAAGLATATLLSICAMTLAAPRRLAVHVLPLASAAAVLLPVAGLGGCFAHAAFQSSYLGYLAAVCAGGVGGTKMSLWAFATDAV